MKKPLNTLLLFIIIFVSCNKNNTPSGKSVEIYLLSSAQYVPNKCQIDSTLSSIEYTPLVKNNDILEYSQSANTFKLNEPAFKKLYALGDGIPFAVTVDRAIIYYGINKPLFSSSSCAHSITMSAFNTMENKISLNLGYPWTIQGITIPDERNNPILISALIQQGKLRR